MGREIRMEINMGMGMEMEMAEGKKKREIYGTAAARCCLGHANMIHAAQHHTERTRGSKGRVADTSCIIRSRKRC